MNPGDYIMDHQMRPSMLYVLPNVVSNEKGLDIFVQEDFTYFCCCFGDFKHDIQCTDQDIFL